jgi:hypothetical protein
MGAGTLYQHKNGELASWVDFEDNDDSFNEFMIEDLGDIIQELGYCKKHNESNVFYNGLFELTLESKYYGDGIIFMLEPRYDEYDKRYNLACANFLRCETRILRAVQKAGYTLNIATSGYAAKTYVV